MEEHDARRLQLLLGTVLLLVVAGGIVDLYLDAPASWLTPHVIFEVGLVAFSFGAAVYLWRGWWSAARSLEEARTALEERSVERDAWRASAQSALEGLGRAIDRQFQAWSLTPTEREIALLLLKGHSHKRIANQTGRSERTVRQHSVSVYEKAGLAGRAELAAFFLDDLILPASDRAAGNLQPPGPRTEADVVSSPGSA